MSLLGNLTARVWLGLFVLYVTFFYWYTSFGGPLTAEEVARYRAVVEAVSGGAPERVAAWQRFMQTDTGDDFGMISVIDLRDTPKPIEGVAPGTSSETMLEAYTEPFFAEVIPLAAHPVLVGWAAAPPIDLWGIDGATHWSQGVVVRWRSRRDFMQFASGILEASEDGNIHDFKIAAIEKTIAYPLDPWFHFGDPRLVLALLFALVGLGSQVASGGNRPAGVGP